MLGLLLIIVSRKTVPKRVQAKLLHLHHCCSSSGVEKTKSGIRVSKARK